MREVAQVGAGLDDAGLSPSDPPVAPWARPVTQRAGVGADTHRVLTEFGLMS